MKPFRDRKFCLMLYPKEDDSHFKALKSIEETFYSYAYIVHNKDVSEESGELLKEHVHVLLSFPNARFNTALANELGIEINYIQGCKNFKKALEYLIHYNEDTKHQYDIEEVKGDLKKKLEKFMNNDGKEEFEQIADIYQWIVDCGHYVDIMALQRYCMGSGMWSTMRRNYSIIKDYLYEWNNRFLSKPERNDDENY